MQEKHFRKSSGHTHLSARTYYQPLYGEVGPHSQSTHVEMAQTRLELDRAVQEEWSGFVFPLLDMCDRSYNTAQHPALNQTKKKMPQNAVICFS